MVQSAFAIFFVLALYFGMLSLLVTLRDNAAAIRSALRGEMPAPREDLDAELVRRSERPTAEMPYVARRLVALSDEQLAPVTETPRIWAFRRADPALG